jgi:hypothetical protein
VVFLITLFYPLSICDKKGEKYLIWTGIVFFTGQVIFVPKWPKGELLVFVLTAFYWTKSLLRNVAALSRVYSSAMFFKKIL